MVKKCIVFTMGFFVLVATAVPIVQAEDIKIGYVDTRKVLTESKQGKKARVELEKIVKAKTAELDKQEKTLKNLQAAFEKDKLILKPEQIQARQKEFQEKVGAYQKLKAESQRELQQKDQEFSRKTLGEIQKVVAEVAKEKNLSLVFDAHERPVIYSAPGPDLTDEVLKKYNAQAK